MDFLKLVFPLKDGNKSLRTKTLAFFLALFYFFGQIPQVVAMVSHDKSISSFAFLIGDWEIEHTYNPGTDKSRTVNGNLTCRRVLADRYIRCVYKMMRAGKDPAFTIGYFNYNSIYKKFEVVWISSTWAIKVLMKGDLRILENRAVITTFANFQIENDITEYVKGELMVEKGKSAVDFFKRETFIRTSKSKESAWRHHMTEIARRKGASHKNNYFSSCTRCQMMRRLTNP